MSELTKEQQVRALREARYKRRQRQKPAPLTVKKLLEMPDEEFGRLAQRVCPRCLMFGQEVRELEAEVKSLKRELAKRK